MKEWVQLVGLYGDGSSRELALIRKYESKRIKDGLPLIKICSHTAYKREVARITLDWLFCPYVFNFETQKEIKRLYGEFVAWIPRKDYWKVNRLQTNVWITFDFVPLDDADVFCKELCRLAADPSRRMLKNELDARPPDVYTFKVGYELSDGGIHTDEFDVNSRSGGYFSDLAADGFFDRIVKHGYSVKDVKKILFAERRIYSPVYEEIPISAKDFRKSLKVSSIIAANKRREEACNAN
jgi:hypothetical protein